MDAFARHNGAIKHKRKLKFVILTPRDLTGGAIVRHQLCALLREEGYNAKVLFSDIYGYRPEEKALYTKKWIRYIMKDTKYAVYTRAYAVLCKLYPKAWNPKYQSYMERYIYYPVKGCRRKYLPFIDKNTVMVYPEVTFGNPLNAKKVVRWFLYFNPLHGQKDAYGQNDMFFCYRSKFNDEELNPEGRVLNTPYFDLNYYKQTNFGARHGKCYIVRKAKGRDCFPAREDLPTDFDGVIIDDLPEDEKIRVFNECEYCISYDTQTAYASIASLCGCISIVVPEPGKTRADYKGEGEKGWGVAWGFEKEEIEFAINTRKQLYDYYERINLEAKESARNFARLCEAHFDMK